MEKTREEIMLVFSTISMVSIRLREVFPLPENKDERLCFVLRFINEAVDKELAYLSQDDSLCAPVETYPYDGPEEMDCDQCGKDVTKDQAAIWSSVLVICKECLAENKTKKEEK